jgi:hypothetical protein
MELIAVVKSPIVQAPEVNVKKIKGVTYNCSQITLTRKSA